MGQGRDIIVPEGRDTVTGRGFLCVPMSRLRMFEELARKLVSREVILFTVLLSRGTVGVRRSVVQLRRTLMVLVM
jgi:hypothetical protein